MTFYLCSSVVTIVSGLLIHVFILKSSKEKCASFLITFTLLTIFTTFIIAEKENSQNQEKLLWNGGICSICQEPWNFSNASRNGAITHYYYFCDNCGKVIDLTQQFPIDN